MIVRLKKQENKNTIVKEILHYGWNDRWNYI